MASSKSGGSSRLGLLRRAPQILAFKRECLPQADFSPAWANNRLISDIALCTAWRRRSKVEHSWTWVQPIAAAIVRRGDDYLVLRRIDGTRGDLRSRISLISGGHVDFVDTAFDFEAILEETLSRELNEELGFAVTSRIERLGVVVDHASLESSRHVAFLFEVFVTDDAQVLAGEEFVVGSSFSGSFVDLATLSLFSPNFDPWSRIVWRDLLHGRLDTAMGATPQQLSIRGLPHGGVAGNTARTRMIRSL